MAEPRTPRTPRTPGSSSPASPAQPRQPSSSKEQTYAKSPAKPSSPSQPGSSSIGRTPRTPRSSGITPSRSVERTPAPKPTPKPAKVPSSASQSKPKPVSAKAPSYQVKPGDTMSAIAKRSGVKLDDLIEANLHIRNPNQIYAGQQLSIPRGGYAPSQRPPTAFDQGTQLAAARTPAGSPRPPIRLPAGSGPNTYGPVAQPQAKYGDRGPSVEALQHWLKNKGYDPGTPDGIWGPQTEKAYQAAKRAGGVDWTTIYGKTKTPSAAIRDANAVAGPPSPYSQAGGLGSGYGKPSGAKSINQGNPLYDIPSSVAAPAYGRPQLSQAAASRLATAAKYNGEPLHVGDTYRSQYTKPDSEHQKGNAIDLDQGYYGPGGGIGGAEPTNERWLRTKAALEKAGFKMLQNPKEWWHWSLDGT